jgi:hypothetical protein
MWLYLLHETNLLSAPTKRMLHFAPEPTIAQRLSEHPAIDYLSGDLDPALAMEKVDITDIQYPDDSFDVVCCSHVLEHVPDDRRAIRELFRVLRPGGWAIIQVPIWRATTDEDPAVTDPAQRTERFGQFDHARAYGKDDYPSRLAAAGFHVIVDPYPRRIGQWCVERYGLTPLEDIHYCRKVAGVPQGSVVRYWADDALRHHATLAGDASAATGRVERVRDRGVSGWVWNPGKPSERVTVRVWVDGSEAGTATADLPRPSLAAAGIGDGCHGFRVDLDAGRVGPGYHRLRVEADGGVALSPAVSYTCEAARASDPWFAVDFSAQPDGS